MQVAKTAAIVLTGSMWLSGVASANPGRASLSTNQANLRSLNQSVAAVSPSATKQERRNAAALPGPLDAGAIAAAVGSCTEPTGNCQTRDSNDADSSNRIDFIVAEGFSPTIAGDVSNLCWWGAYDDGAADCQGIVPDTFEVNYYTNAGGVPGSLIASFSQAMGTLTVAPPIATGVLVAGFAPEYEYTAAHAAVPVAAGQCYWVEISNMVDTAASPGCVWFWERASGADSRGFQDGAPPDGYAVDDTSIFDHAICLNVPLAPAGACYPDPPVNDNCANSITITNGTTYFDTTSATTDGPAEPGCMFPPGGGDFVNQDIWFDYTATCSGSLQVSLCGSSYDTNLAVYDGATCPMGAAAILCGDDECPAPGPLQTQVSVPVMVDQVIKIRVGGFSNTITPGMDVGPGSIDLLCGDPLCLDACTLGAGDCFAPAGNGTGGCDDVACCETVCTADEFCCCTEWDSICAAAAALACQGVDAFCATATGDCCQDNMGSPGCGTADCCVAVCTDDPFCCDSTWDAICAASAATLCDPLCNACPDGVIAWLDPADGFRDARQPTDIGDAALLQGVSEISVSGPLGAEALECWSLCETAQNPALHPPGSGANSIMGVTTAGGGVYTLTLAHPLTPGEITRVSYTSTSGTTLSTATLAVLPGDVNGDGTSSPADILAVIDSLNGVAPLPISQTDTDRSTVAGPEDILRVIDLLNGASAFEPWFDASAGDGIACP